LSALNIIHLVVLFFNLISLFYDTTHILLIMEIQFQRLATVLLTESIANRTRH